jgi:hypothetical protein
MKPTQFHDLIYRILKEEVEKSVTDTPIYQRVPEVNTGEDYKKIMPNPRDSRSKVELLDDITKVVKDIDPDIVPVWDDHDDIMLSARDIFNIRIIPKWENNFSIEALIRNEDRIFVVGQTWDQVKQFVKVNLKDSTTYKDKTWDRNIENRKDQTPSPDKGMPQKDKPKVLPFTDKPPKETKNKDKNYTEKDVKKDDDLQNKPLKEVGSFKKQDSFKPQNVEKLRKEKTKFPEKKPNTTLTVKQ